MNHPPVNRPPVNGPEILQRTAAYARRRRAQVLVAISTGEMTLRDAVELADRDMTIRPLRVHQAVVSQPGVGPVVARRVISRMFSVLELSPGDAPHWKRVTFGWVVDGRSGGRRYLAWEEALLREGRGRRDLLRTALNGFPFAAVEAVGLDLKQAAAGAASATSAWDMQPPGPVPVPQDPWAAAPDGVPAPAGQRIDPWAGAPR